MNKSRLNLTSPMRILCVGLFWAFAVVTVGSVYTGTRFGKRDSASEELSSRVMQRNSGLRTIQSRSTAERRFYPGTRFGGKRSYWPPMTILAGSGTDSSDGYLGHQTLTLSNIPYDCVYIPFVGVRCSKPGENVVHVSGSTGHVNYPLQGELRDLDDDEVAAHNTNENGVNSAVTGIDP